MGQKGLSFAIGGFFASAIFLTILLFMWIIPNYSVWQQQKAGEAELARAEQSRQIAVQEAKAKLDSAEMLAQAEVKRAEGTAKANQIIGESLKNNEAYIHWLWVEAIKDSKDQIIYIPTEANVPITESSRLGNKKEK